MTNIQLYTVDHRYPARTKDGGIVRSLIVDRDCFSPNLTYADMCAQYAVWQGLVLAADANSIVGFQGYRKHLDFRPGATVKGDWVDMTMAEFKAYQEWQKHYAAPNIEFDLRDADILTAPPFDVSYNTNIEEDFKLSASATDWEHMKKTMLRFGDFDFSIKYVVGYCNIVTTVDVFNKWMTLWNMVRAYLERSMFYPCPDPGPRPDIYLPRRMAFLSERIFSIWLASSGLKAQQLPLLVCWEYK
jgi:hypothetical protein